MTWYNTGTASVPNGSTTVTGVGTSWAANVKVGEAFQFPGEPAYEITEITNNTQIKITPAYLGSSKTNSAYTVVPVKGFAQRAYEALTSAIETFNTHINGALQGRFGRGTTGEPGVAAEDDIGTGLSWPTDGQLSFSTSGIRRLLMTTTQFNLNLPITGSAVQDDAVDGTAGKVLLTGAFGLGATDEALTRLDVGNGPLPSGFYSGSGGNADAATFPVTGARSHPFLSLNRRISAGVYGIARVFFNGNVPVIWTSSDNGSNWDDPNTLYGSENLLGMVSETGGNPTGAVIEHGENANGYYTRFADGTQICWRRNWSGWTRHSDLDLPSGLSRRPGHRRGHGFVGQHRHLAHRFDAVVVVSGRKRAGARS